MRAWLQKQGHVLFAFFTMPCIEMIKNVDLDRSRLSFALRFRVCLHSLLCRPCTKYMESGVALKRALRFWFLRKRPDFVEQTERLNSKVEIFFEQP